MVHRIPIPNKFQSNTPVGVLLIWEDTAPKSIPNINTTAAPRNPYTNSVSSHSLLQNISGAESEVLTPTPLITPAKFRFHPLDISASDEICYKYCADQTNQNRHHLAFWQFFSKHKPSQDCHPDRTHKHQHSCHTHRNSGNCHTIAHKADTVCHRSVKKTNHQPLQINL